MFGDRYRTVFALGSRPLCSQRATPPRRTSLSLEPLEVRATPAIITITGVGDSIAVDGFITLREALTAANFNAASGDAPAGDSGLDTIKFNISGAPGTVHTIQPMSALPTITDPVFIDGYSQLGASPNTLTSGDNAFLAIELDGTLGGFHSGLTIASGNSTVQGLVINHFKNEGILVVTKGGNTIRGNFIGTDATGKLDRGNGIAGVALLTSNNTVGGFSPADRNLISGNEKSNEKPWSPMSKRPIPHEIKILIDAEDGHQDLFVLPGTPEGDAVHFGFGTFGACHGVAN